MGEMIQNLLEGNKSLSLCIDKLKEENDYLEQENADLQDAINFKEDVMRDNVDQLTKKVRELQNLVWWLWLFCVTTAFVTVGQFGAFLAVLWKMKETI